MGGSLSKRPGDGQALALAAREAHPLFADEGVQTLGHGHDKVVGVGVLEGIDDFGLGGVEAAVGDVVAHGVVEQDGLLGDHADLAPERGQGDVPDIVAVDQ